MSEEKKEKKDTGIWGWIKDILVAILIAALILVFIKPTIVKESSMQPTLYENDYLILSKQSYKMFGEPERGDIIVLHSDLTTETGMEKLLIKRIIGLPGDTVEIIYNEIYVNGEYLDEDYIMEKNTVAGDLGTYFEVPEGKLFVLGDNRRVSADSRSSYVGYVPIEDVMGKAVLRLYPFNKITLFK